MVGFLKQREGNGNKNAGIASPTRPNQG